MTKGSFFHHFAGKEDLARAAAEHWGRVTGELFAAAPYHAPADPVERLLAYVDFRKELIAGDIPDFTCLAGTMLQEVYATHSGLRDAAAAAIVEHAATLAPDIEAAMAARGIAGAWTAESLALHIQAVIQGAFVLAKAAGPGAAVDCLDHLHRYLKLLFQHTEIKEETS